MSLWIDRFMNRGEVDLDNYCLTHEDFMKAYTTKPKEKTIVYEEGRNSFDRNKHSHTENKEARDALRQYRKFHHTLFINFQDVSDLQPELVNKIAHCLIRTPSKGVAHLYGRKDMRSMWNQRYFQGWKDPGLRGFFPNPEKKIPELWEEYENKATQQLEDNGVDEYENIELLTVGEAADIVNASNVAIRNWCDEGKLDYKRLPNNDRRIVKESLYSLLD